MKPIIIVLLVAFLLSACSNSTGGSQLPIAERTINVVTTTGMLADIVKNVGDDRVQVTALMGPGVDAHLYKASEGDVLRLQEKEDGHYSRTS